MKFPKHQYIRSKKLLKLVAELECQHCGRWGLTQAAHANKGGGRGKGIKADDNWIAALCVYCHQDIDQGNRLTREQRWQVWENAHHKTVDRLVKTGKWPVDIPIPAVSECGNG